MLALLLVGEMMNINKLKEPIILTLEQFECEACTKKIYINSEDKIQNAQVSTKPNDI